MFVLVSFIVSIPATASAGFFSDLVSVFSGQAQADESGTSTEGNLQNIDILETNSTDPDIKNSTSTDEDFRMGWDGSYIESNGSLGSGVPMEKSTISDQIRVYTVKEGDTLSEIADMADVSVNTIRWENNITGQKISVGQKLNILPVTGVKHVVKSGDTVSKIADKYEADSNDIMIFNDISKGDALKKGDIIFVPNGIIKPAVVTSHPASNVSKTPISNTKVDSGYYIRPVAGPITSPFGPRKRGFHPGVDIGNARGTPIMAAATGTVTGVVSGCVEGRKYCGGGYGNHIEIIHSNGTTTRYAHLSRTYVSVGETVTQGQQIGTLGNTGTSTGPHLHFEVINANGSKMKPPVY